MLSSPVSELDFGTFSHLEQAGPCCITLSALGLSAPGCGSLEQSGRLLDFKRGYWEQGGMGKKKMAARMTDRHKTALMLTQQLLQH